MHLSELKTLKLTKYMGVYFFPSEFVYWVENSEHSKMKDELMRKIKATESIFHENNQMTVNAITSFVETDTDDTMSFLNEPRVLEELVYKPFGNMIKEYNKRNSMYTLGIEKCIVENGWYTWYKSGGSFGIHNHDDYAIKIRDDVFKSSFSFIYILNDTNERNSTQFFVPSMCRSSATKEDEYTFYTGDIPEIKEGTILIFPSSLYHEVAPCIKPDRITIAYNMKCCYASP